MSDTSPSISGDPPVQGSRERRFIRNSGFSVLQQFVAMALAVLLVPFLLWRLGTEVYGLWLTLQIFSILGLLSLAELGFQGAIVRYLVRFHAAGDQLAYRRLLITAFVLFAAIGVLCSAGVVLFAQTSFVEVFAIPAGYREEMRFALSIYGLGLLIGFPALVLKAFFTGMQDLATVKIWETLDRIIFTVLVVGALSFTDQLLALVLVEQLTMLGLFGAFVWYARRRHRPWFSVNPRYASAQSLKGVGGLSGMVFATNASSLVYIKAPEVLIGAGLGPVALAYFQIATRIPRVLKSLQGSLNAAVLPYVAGLDDDAESLEAKRRFALLGLRFNYLVFVPIAVFVAIFAPDILRLWVGEEFAFLGLFLALYALWQLSSIITGFGTATLTRTAHYRRLVWQFLALNVLFLVALVALLEPYGLLAVFVALVVSGVASAGMALAASREANGFTYGQFARQVLLGPVLGSAAVAGLLFGIAKVVLVAAGPVIGVGAIALAGLGHLAVIYFAILDNSDRMRLALALAKLRRGN